MPEKVRRIKNKKENKQPRWKKRVFFILVTVFIFSLGVIVLQGKDSNSKEQKLQVKDTTAVAAVCTQAGCGAINKNAIVFEHISRPSGSLLFRIDLPNLDKQIAVTETAIEKEVVQELLFLQKKLKDTTDIHLSTASALGYNKKDFDIKTQDGWVLKISTENNANITAAVLRQTLHEIGEAQDSLEYIDLRIPSRVYYTFK